MLSLGDRSINQAVLSVTCQLKCLYFNVVLPSLPFHFLITAPPPTSLAESRTRLFLHYSIFSTVPHFLLVLRCDPIATENGHLQWSLLSCASFLTPCLLHTMYVSLSPQHLFQACTLGTGHRSVQAPRVWWGNYSSFCSPLAAAHCSSVSGPSAVITSLHAVGVIALLVHSRFCSHQLRNWSSFLFWSAVCFLHILVPLC